MSTQKPERTDKKCRTAAKHTVWGSVCWKRTFLFLCLPARWNATKSPQSRLVHGMWEFAPTGIWFPKLRSASDFGCFWSIAHTPPFLSVPSARTEKWSECLCFKGFWCFGTVFCGWVAQKKLFFRVIFFVFQTALKFAARTTKLTGSLCFKDFCYFFRSATGG